jgi:peroxiredoxin (alkyl hydroperoxide reductase subunit C)
MLGIGKKFPEFKLKGVKGTDVKTAFSEVSNVSYPGQWLVVFFYPKDFTFVCPTEIKGFGDLNKDFQNRETQILGVSTDNEFVHLAWLTQKEELKDLPFPLLSDIRRDLSGALGILNEGELVAERATYIVDPNGIIRYLSVNDMNVGRNPKEVLRVLDALQTDELCPCNWEKGKETIKV